MIGYEDVKKEFADPDTTGDTSLRVTRSARALVRGCRNTGEIETQNITMLEESLDLPNWD